MKGLRSHPLRVTGRFFWFVGVVLAAVFDFLAPLRLPPGKFSARRPRVVAATPFAARR